MRRKVISVVAFTGLMAFGWQMNSVRAQAPADAPTVTWQRDLQAAQKLSEQSGRPMLIVFRADWCAHCNRFEKETLGNPTMAECINRDFIPVRLDFDKEQKTAEILEVKALPCTVILSPQADLLGRVVGAKPPKDFWEALQDAKDEHVRIHQARFASSESAATR